MAIAQQLQAKQEQRGYKASHSGSALRQKQLGIQPAHTRAEAKQIAERTNNEQETVMKKMKNSAHGGHSPWTLGELVTLAFDVTPNRARAVKLLGVLLGGRAIKINGRMNSGG